MKFCTKCGQKLTIDMKFCTKCGTPLPKDLHSPKTPPVEEKEDKKGHTASKISTSTVQLNEVHNASPDHAEAEEGKTGETARRTKDILLNREQSPLPKETIKKRNVPKWAYIAGAAFILSAGAIFGFSALNEDKSNENEMELADASGQGESEPPAISEEEAKSLFPDWEMIRQENVKIKKDYYTILAIAQDEIEFEEKVKIAVVDYNGKDQEDPWRIVWEQEDYYYADSMMDAESYIGDLQILSKENSSKALVVFNVMHGGTARTYETVAIELNEDGTGDVAWTGYGSTIENKGDYIEVSTLGAVQLSLDENEVLLTEIPRSEAGSENALKIPFVLNSEGIVEPAEDDEIYIKADQPITFIPGDEKTKKLFDDGEIDIFYDSMENSPIIPANVNLIYTGNEFSFSTPGSYGFLLYYYSDEDNDHAPPYTFIVHVGDGIKPEKTNKKDDQLAKTNEIEAPFPIGTPISELKAHYGNPSYDGYFAGGKLIVFDKEGYFIDELEETVSGYFFADPKITVFGATVGMTGKEINEIYGESVEPYFDEAELQTFVYSYSKNGFNIFFHADEETGPTSSVIVIKQ